MEATCKSKLKLPSMQTGESNLTRVLLVSSEATVSMEERMYLLYYVQMGQAQLEVGMCKFFVFSELR